LDSAFISPVDRGLSRKYPLSGSSSILSGLAGSFILNGVLGPIPPVRKTMMGKDNKGRIFYLFYPVNSSLFSKV
jgi:hypothetical protein